MFRRLSAIIAMWGALSAAAHAACDLHLIADLKATMQDGSPLVQAKINGVEVTMIADSGAFYSALTRGTVAQFKLPIEMGDPSMYAVGIGGRQAIYVTKVNAFTIAGETIPNAAFTVTDNELGHGVGGVMGQNVLGVKDAYYDLPDGLIRIIRAEGCGDRPFLVWDASKPYSIIPLIKDYAQFKHVTAEAFVNGKKITVLFDTGASSSVLSLDAAKRAGLDPSGAGATRGDLHRGIGRRFVESWIVPLDSFKIGDEEIRHTKLTVAPMTLLDVDMLLGADFFLSHRVYVANSQQRIYFTYTGGAVFNLGVPPQTTDKQMASAAAAPAKPEDKAAGDYAATPEPSDADGFSRRGTAFASRRQFGPAIADLTRAIALAPSDARYLDERARIYWQSGRPDLAMTDIDRALKLKPDDSAALVIRAALRLDSKDRAGAMADLDAADLVLAKESDARLEMGNLYQRAEAAPAAVKQFSLWIKAHPADNRLAQALNDRCWVRALWNIEPDKALADCDAALRRYPNAAEIYDSRGLAHLRLGQNELAIADYDKALGANPKIAWSLYGRGVAKVRKGQTAEGKTDVAAASALNPKLPEVAKAHGLDR
jgi:tetratricopeptide (TPR) repeat protein/predicted aspartyl protease